MPNRSDYVPVRRKRKLAQSGEVARPELFRLTSPAECLFPGDAVEKVYGILLTHNNRIIDLDFLNLTCAFDAHFEINVAERSPQSFFHSIGPRPPNFGVHTSYRLSPVDRSSCLLIADPSNARDRLR